MALGINNGWFDAALQNKAYIDFSYNNTYRQLINDDQASSYMESYNNACLPAIKSCDQSGRNFACANADVVCMGDIQTPITRDADFNVYDVRKPSDDPNPPDTYKTYLRDPEVKKAIGAQSNYEECSDTAGNPFQTTGDSKFLW